MILFYVKKIYLSRQTTVFSLAKIFSVTVAIESSILQASGFDSSCSQGAFESDVAPLFNPKAFTLQNWPWIPKILPELMKSQDPTSVHLSVSSIKIMDSLGISFRQVDFPISYPIMPQDNSAMGKAYNQLRILFSTTSFSSIEDFKAKLTNWFNTFTQGELKPIFLSEILERSKQLSELTGIPEDQFIVESQFFLQPKIYGILAREGLIPILDIHDILQHAPLLVSRRAREVAKNYFQFTSDLPPSSLYYDPNLSGYRDLRFKYFEDFQFLDKSSHLFVIFGGISGRVSMAFLDLLEWTPLISSRPGTDRGFWRSLKQRLSRKFPDSVIRKVIASKYIAAKALRDDVPNFASLSQKKQALLAWLYISAVFESSPELSKAFSLENSLLMWRESIEKSR